MKIKLIDSYFDEENGISYARINTDYGEFEGWSQLHEEDKSISSTFAGCQYAETKAILKYMKYRIKLINERIKALEDCQKALMYRKNYEHNSVENRTIRKQIYLLKKQRTDWKERRNSLTFKLIESMTKREELINKMTKNKQEKGVE